MFFSERAFEKLSNRKSKVASYYLDMKLVGQQWGWYGGDKRGYHHTSVQHAHPCAFNGCNPLLTGGLLEMLTLDLEMQR